VYTDHQPTPPTYPISLTSDLEADVSDDCEPYEPTLDSILALGTDFSDMPTPPVSQEKKMPGCITRSFSDINTSLSYAQTLSVLALVYSLCTDAKTGRILDLPRHMSLRDVYYSLKHIFPNQASCNSILLDVGRWRCLWCIKYPVPSTH